MPRDTTADAAELHLDASADSHASQVTGQAQARRVEERTA
jgi:hypothetical protein